MVFYCVTYRSLSRVPAIEIPGTQEQETCLENLDRKQQIFHIDIDILVNCN